MLYENLFHAYESIWSRKTWSTRTPECKWQAGWKYAKTALIIAELTKVVNKVKKISEMTILIYYIVLIRRLLMEKILFGENGQRGGGGVYEKLGCFEMKSFKKEYVEKKRMVSAGIQRYLP